MLGGICWEHSCEAIEIYRRTTSFEVSFKSYVPEHQQKGWWRVATYIGNLLMPRWSTPSCHPADLWKYWQQTRMTQWSDPPLAPKPDRTKKMEWYDVWEWLLRSKDKPPECHPFFRTPAANECLTYLHHAVQGTTRGRTWRKEVDEHVRANYTGPYNILVLVYLNTTSSPREYHTVSGSRSYLP